MDNNNKNLHDTVDTIEDDCKSKKAKESFLLLKQKMCKTHDLIKQYNEKLKEVDCLKSELKFTKKDSKHIKINYHSILDETRKLELQIAQEKLENEKLSNKLKEYEVNIAADKQIIQQLTYKINESQEECSSKIIEYDVQKSVFEAKIKDLEHELQKSKVMYKRKERKSISNNSDTAKLNIETKSCSDIGINVSLDAKPKVQEKSIMTDEFYNIKDDPYPLFCAKCESHLPSAITPEKICKTMCTYPELIEKDFLPLSKTIVSSPRLIPSTCPDSTNRNEDFILSRSLSTSRLNLCSQYNGSTGNCKSQSISATIQNCESNELRNANIATHTSIPTKVPSNNLNSISATCTSFQSMDCTKRDFYSNNLLDKHSASLEEIKEQIRSLGSRIKKLKRLKEKSDTNSCHCNMNYNNNALLNSNILAIICQGIAEYYNKKKETCSKNEQNINSENDKKVKPERRRLNKFNEDENASLWKTEDLDESCRDTLYNNSEVTTKTTVCDTLQSKHKICINKSNVMSNANVPNKFLNDNDEYDREFIFCKENALNSAEVASVENNLTTSYLSTDNLYNSIEEMSNNSLSEDNVKTIDKNDQIKMKVSSCNSDSIDDADDRIIDTISEGNKIKRKSQNKNKFGDRLFKKIRNLKRKVQANSHVNKEESIELYPDDYKPIKKLRIAHAPKTSVLQSSNNQEDFTHSIIKDISLESFQRKHNQRLNVQRHNSLTKNKQDCTISKKCNKKNAEDEHNNTNSINDSRSTRKIYEKNLVPTNSEDCFQNNDNSALSVIDIKCASTVSEFDKCDNVSIQSTSKESTLMEGITEEMSNNCDELESHNNVSDNVANDAMLEKSIPVTTQVIIQSESSILCKDSKFDTNKFTENLQVKTTDAIKKETTPSIELQYVCNITRESSLNDDHEIPKNMDINDVLMLNQWVVKEVTEYHNNSDVSSEASERFLERDDEIIVENYIDDNNVHKSVDEANNTLGEQEMHVNEITDKQAIREETPCTNQQEDEEMELINHTSHDDVEQFQTPMSLLNKYINDKYINHKLSQKKIYCRKITDKFVKKQLKRLLNNAWEDSSVHYDIIEKLENTRCGARIIAKCIVEFLLESVKHDEPLDKSFTPPAPLMTSFEQKLTALLVDLEMSKPTVVHYVQVAIEYKLFKLNSEAKTHVNSLTRIYLILSRIQKDRERVRIMCCNALYSMNLMSINVLYTIFTSWPEVLPNAEINKEILPKCVAFLIATQHVDRYKSEKLGKKLIGLKHLISTFYKYSYTVEKRNDIVKELMTLLKAKRCNGLDTAILLVAKKGGSSWTYKDIIQSNLLPMIINYEHPCIYSAFSLLGRLMRAFPLEDEDNIVQEIAEQLCDLIQSGEGTHDQQEGIISALLSLSRHNFDVIVPPVLKWMPNKPLRWIVIAQLQALINMRNKKFWKNYLQHRELK